MAPRLSVVILSWNRREDTLRALQSTYDAGYESLEVVVVDAASDDGSADAVAASFPDVVLVRLPANRGVPGNRNAGVEAATGEYLFFLDNDATVSAGSFHVVVEQFEKRATLGAVGVKVLDGDRDAIDQATWVYPHDPGTWADQPFMTYTFCGGAVGLRRSALESAGRLWDDLRFAREEEDLALRLLDAGFDIAYLPTASIRHYRAADVRTSDERKLVLDLRNMLWVLWANLPLLPAARLSVLRALLYLFRGLRRRAPLTAVRGVAEALGGIGIVRAHRRPVRRATWRRYQALNPRVRAIPTDSEPWRFVP